jgi:hypothetical protein
MYLTIIASVLLISAPARTQAEVALYIELESLEKQLSTAAAAEYKGFDQLLQQMREQMYSPDVSLADKLAVVGRMVKVADNAAPLGARVAARFERAFEQVGPQLKWEPMRDSFRKNYHQRYVEKRAFMRRHRLDAIVSHRWGWEKGEGPRVNYACYHVASVLLTREKPDHRDLLLWRVAWAEVYLTDAWAAMSAPAPKVVARAG